MAQVVLENIYKTFPRQRDSGATLADVKPDIEPSKDTEVQAATQIAVLRRINLQINDGEFMVLVGPSGCGKSTLLRLISGLESLTGGHITVGQQRVNDLPPKQRDIAMVFQSYALYPHLNVYDNLAFGLRRTPGDLPRSPTWETAVFAATRRLPPGLQYWPLREQEIRSRVMQVARSLQIDTLLGRLPRQLSGGQKQRVALGRAMARNPAVFLMDEPLSNLDAKLRTETRGQIVSLQRQLGTTTIYVTHDQVEAMTMGDRIAVMDQGEIQQVAPPLELYHRPANRFVATFIGSPPMNFLPVQVQPPLIVTHPQFRLTLPGTWETVLQQYAGQPLTLGIRPEHLRVSLPAPKNLPAQVTRIEALGSETYLTVDLAGQSLQVRLAEETHPQPGEACHLSLMPEKIHLFNAAGEALRASEN